MRVFTFSILAATAAYAVIVAYRPEPAVAPPPKPETCQAELGWTAVIEKAENTWACVHRKGKKVYAFFY